MKNKRNSILRYGICFFILLFLCWLFPYTGDDWAWGSNIGIERLKVWFYNYNGRYMGNIMVILMTRSNFIKSMIMSITLTGIIFCIEKIFQRKWIFYISCMIMILLPKEIFQQAIVWTAGFSNYVISVFLILIYIVYVYPVLSGILPQKKYWHCIPIFILGISSTLFMEHMTIYAVVIALGVVLYTLLKYKKLFIQHLIFLTGSLIGAFYMFHNGAYRNVINGEDSYRTMGGDVIECAVTNYKSVIVEQLCLNNVWINLIIAIICYMLFYQYKKMAVNKKCCVLMKGSLFIIIFYSLWSVFSSFGLATAFKQNRIEYFEGGATLLFLLAVIIFSICIGVFCNCLWKILFWNGSILCLTLPLLVVTPIGPRCFFVTYIMFVLLFMELCCQFPSSVENQIFETSALGRTCIFVSCVGMLFYFIIFSSVAQIDKYRLEHIKSEVAKGNNKVEIIHLPYESYLWMSTPLDDFWKERYKLFHKLPENLVLIDV